MQALGYFLLNTVQLVFLCTWSIFWITAALLVSVFSARLPLRMARWVWGPGLVWVSGATVEVERNPRVDDQGPYVFLMNHQSMIDIPFAFSYLPCNLRFVAKKVLKGVPFLGWYMWRTGMVFVDRRDRSQAVASLEQAGRQIRAGATILAYPEGTRSMAGEILPFKKGPFVVAIASQVPIVPVAIDGTHKLLPRGGFKVRPGHVRMKVGDPIPTAGLTQDDIEPLMRKVRDAIIDMHVAIGGMGGDREDAIAAPGLEGVGRPKRRHAA